MKEARLKQSWYLNAALQTLISCWDFKTINNHYELKLSVFSIFMTHLLLHLRGGPIKGLLPRPTSQRTSPNRALLPKKFCCVGHRWRRCDSKYVWRMIIMQPTTSIIKDTPTYPPYHTRADAIKLFLLTFSTHICRSDYQWFLKLILSTLWYKMQRQEVL